MSQPPPYRIMPSEVWIQCGGCGCWKVYNRKTAERQGYLDKGWWCKPCSAQKVWEARPKGRSENGRFNE